MKFAFFGYDFFSSAASRLISAGWNLGWTQLFEVDEKYNFSHDIRSISTRQNAHIGIGKVTEKEVKEIVEMGIQVVIVGAYGHRIPAMLHKKIPCINIHPSLLPEGRGPWPLPWTILKKHSISGVSLHLMDDGWDSGPILLQKSFPVDADENLESLSAKCRVAALDLVSALSADFEGILAQARPQIGAGSYWKLPTWDERTIDWCDDPAAIDTLCRAFGKFDTLARFYGKEWICKDIKVWHADHEYECGDVVVCGGAEWVIAVRGGFACVRFFEPDPDEV